eukprot:CAMPEP_0201690638 /NCGR_PEP_ID=MMETSP0578-20130828/4035_1 /ASSEMBLY_ACC=CAM_ASM_000663 /TAXON_ID=267565 /ORGANISM="Skeletonema grethea, Strain CCMP 1804" /LENGTH=521 /DNA_ID=CAMNT_0048175683 /DNA_START=235 /DNA_END=1803 /DNA_ORIENTATION=+
METLYWTGVVAIIFDAEEHMKNYQVVTTTTETETSGTDNEETAAVNDAVPTAALMGKIEELALERTIISTLQILLDDKLYLAALDVKDQFYDRPCVEAVFPEVWDRGDPSKLTLDVTMRITARYIPSSLTVYTDRDLGDVFISGLGDAQDVTVHELKNANTFFNAVTGIAAVSEEDLAESPSSMPSLSPTRDFDQVFETRIDPTPTGSSGIVFSLKTPKGGPSVRLIGMKFITPFEGKLEYEIYSKLGSWRNFVGRTNEFELIASGQVTGKGPKTWVDVIEDDSVGTIVNGNETTTVNYVGWKNIHILGDGGERSFYVTTTKRFLKEDQTSIPILFSSALNSLSESLRQYGMVKSNSELELYEGDGILDYPWPTDPNGKSPYYRRPRGPIITFKYERSPCFPNVNFTGWPCPYVQRTRRPTRNPTRKPTKSPTPLPTRQPTWNPTREPTNAPAVAAITSNATETANSTIDNVQSDEIKEQEKSADTDISSLSKNENGAAMRLSFIASKWQIALYGSLLLLL